MAGNNTGTRQTPNPADPANEDFSGESRWPDWNAAYGVGVPMEEENEPIDFNAEYEAARKGARQDLEVEEAARESLRESQRAARRKGAQARSASNKDSE